MAARSRREWGLTASASGLDDTASSSFRFRAAGAHCAGATYGSNCAAFGSASRRVQLDLVFSGAAAASAFLYEPFGSLASGMWPQPHDRRNAAMSVRRIGSNSVSNHGLRLIQPEFRHEGCGSGIVRRRLLAS